MRPTELIGSVWHCRECGSTWRDGTPTRCFCWTQKPDLVESWFSLFGLALVVLLCWWGLLGFPYLLPSK